MLPIRKLFQRRLGYRLHILAELIKINFDWWEALYILVPGLVLAGSAYLDLLKALPHWFLPGCLNICTIVIILFMVQGIPRTYLVKADLVHVYHNTGAFRKIWGCGQAFSILLKTLPLHFDSVFGFSFLSSYAGCQSG